MSSVGKETILRPPPQKSKGPYGLDIVILDPQKYQGKIISAWSGRAWSASPFELALRRNAVVATNAGFFEYTIDNIPAVPSGISIVEGLWHHEHFPLSERQADHRQAMLFIENTEEGPKLSIQREAPPPPVLKWGDNHIEIDGIDRGVRENEIIAMNRELFITSWLSHGKADDLGYSSVVINEVSSGIRTYVLASGKKKAVLEEAKASGLPLELDLSIPERPGLNAFWGVPIYIENGKTTPRDNRADLHSRTTIGADGQGNIYLIVVSQNVLSFDSIGATRDQMRDIGEFLKLVNMYNLDGGGRSTSMITEGKSVGFPDMQAYEDIRKVSDSLLIINDEM